VSLAAEGACLRLAEAASGELCRGEPERIGVAVSADDPALWMED